MDKQTLIQSHNGILLNNKKKWTADKCKNMVLSETKCCMALQKRESDREKTVVAEGLECGWGTGHKGGIRKF